MDFKVSGSWLALVPWEHLQPQIFRRTDVAPTDFEKGCFFIPLIFIEMSFFIVSLLENFQKSAPTVLKSQLVPSILPCILETTKPALELTKDHEWPSYFSLPLLTFLVKVHQQRQARGHVVVQEGSAMPAKVSGTWRILSRQAGRQATLHAATGTGTLLQLHTLLQIG